MKMIFLVMCFSLLIPSFGFAQELDFNTGVSNTAEFSEEIEINYVKGKIIMPIKIKDKTYKFLLDTGAPTMISTQLGEILQPEIVTEIPVTDANGVQNKIKVVRINGVSIGETSFDNNTALIYDFNLNPALECLGFDGIIGSNFFNKSLLQIDIRNRKVIITNQLKNLNLHGQKSIDLILKGAQGSPYIELKNKDYLTQEEVLLDTGMDEFYDMSFTFYHDNNSSGFFRILNTGKGASSIGLFENNNNEELSRVILPSFEIANSTFKNVVTVTTKDDHSRLGTKYFELGLATFDFLNRKYYFTSYNKGNDLSEPLAGFEPTLKEGKVIIGVVWNEDLKDKLSHGDEILSVNGIVINDLCKILKEDGIFNQANRLDLVIRKANGETETVSTIKVTPI